MVFERNCENAQHCVYLKNKIKMTTERNCDHLCCQLSDSMELPEMKKYLSCHFRLTNADVNWHKMGTYEMRSQLDWKSRSSLNCLANYRCVLIAWLMAVAREYRLSVQTLCLAVEIVDRYAHEIKDDDITNKNYQLIGIASLWIAAKYEEVDNLTAEQCVYITDNSCTIRQLCAQESKILCQLKWQLESLTVWNCVWLILDTVTQTTPEDACLSQFVLCESRRIVNMMRCILCLPDFLRYSNMVKAAALILACFDDFVTDKEKANATEVLCAVIDRVMCQIWTSEYAEKQSIALVYCQAQIQMLALPRDLFCCHVSKCILLECGTDDLYHYLENNMRQPIQIDWTKFKNSDSSNLPTWKRKAAQQVFTLV